MAYRRSRGDYVDERGSVVKDIASRSLYVQSKKYYIDIKESKRGRFLKLSEVAPNGQKMRIVMDLSTCKEFHDRLSEFCEVYSNLGPSRTDGSYYSDGNIKSESIYREDGRFYLDLKENHRGRFLKVSMSLPNRDRSQIVVPAHGMIDIRDALTDMLSEHGQEDKLALPPGEKRQSFMVEDKHFYFDVGSNPRGTYLRISEVVSGGFKAIITIPEEAWDRFFSAIEKATGEPERVEAASS